MATNPRHFYQQLPTYRIKQLYVGLIYVLHKCGMSYVKASVMISVVSVVLIFLFLSFWLAKCVPGLLWGFLSVFLATASSLTAVARLSTPDALSSLLIVIALFLLIEKQSTVGAYFILLLSVLARPDNLILAIVLIIYINFAGPPEYGVSRKFVTSLILVALSIYWSVAILSGYYGWWTVFSHSFLGVLKAPKEFTPAFSFPRYVAVLYAGLTRISFFNIGAAFVGVFFVLTFGSSTFRFKGGSIATHVAIAMAIALVARLILYPLWEDRYFVAYYVMSVILLLVVLRDQQNGIVPRH